MPATPRESHKNGRERRKKKAIRISKPDGRKISEDLSRLCYGNFFCKVNILNEVEEFNAFTHGSLERFTSGD